jgi:hypothetical protein
MPKEHTMLQHSTLRAGLAGLLITLATSACDSQAAIHAAAKAADAWSEIPRVIWPPPQTPFDDTPITPVESAGAPRAEAADDVAANPGIADTSLPSAARL